MKRNNLLLISLFFCVASASCTPQKSNFLNLITDKIESHEITFTSKHIDTEYKIGQRISGDFDGSGTACFAEIKLTFEGTGNRVADENTTSDEYTVLFSDSSIAPLPIYCCDATLIYEGDLNNDGADEISIYQSPENGCTYRWTTYTYKNGAWANLFDTFLIPTGCEPWMTDKEYFDRVVLEDGVVYYLENDFNSSDFRLRKVRAILQ